MTTTELNTVLEILLNPHTLITKQVDITCWGSGTKHFAEEIELLNNLVFRVVFDYVNESVGDGYESDSESIEGFSLGFWDGDDNCHEIELTSKQEKRVKHLLIDGYYNELG